jgi:hypothetical protein
MPNGADRTFVRLCGTLDGFRVAYDHWPTEVRLGRDSLKDLKHILSPESFAQVQSKVRLVGVKSGFEARDEQGNVFDYSTQGFSGRPPEPTAEEWLGVHPRPELW